MPVLIRLAKYTVYLILLAVLTFLLFLAVISLADFRPADQAACEVLGQAGRMTERKDVFTIETWNIGYFGLGSGSDFFYDGGRMTRPDLSCYVRYSGEALAYMELDSRKDFSFFQEIDLNSRRSYRDNQAERLTKVFAGYEYSTALNYVVPFVPMPLREPLGRVRSGIVTFTAYPSAGIVRYAFPSGFCWPLSLFMLDRCFLLTRIPLHMGRDLVLINTHNEAFDNGSQRIQQMAILMETMQSEYGRGNYVVAGGDWNVNPHGYDPEQFITGYAGTKTEPAMEAGFLPRGWQCAYDPLLPTNRNVSEPYRKGLTPVTIIDFFVVSPNVEVLEIKTKDLGFLWSDHNPVWMEFRLKDLFHDEEIGGDAVGE